MPAQILSQDTRVQAVSHASADVLLDKGVAHLLACFAKECYEAETSKDSDPGRDLL